MYVYIYIYTLSPKSVLDSTRKSKFRIHLRYFVLKGFVSTMFVSRVTEFRPRCLLLQMFVITNVSSFVSTMFFFFYKHTVLGWIDVIKQPVWSTDRNLPWLRLKSHRAMVLRWAATYPWLLCSHQILGPVGGCSSIFIGIYPLVN